MNKEDICKQINHIEKVLLQSVEALDTLLISKAMDALSVLESNINPSDVIAHKSVAELRQRLKDAYDVNGPVAFKYTVDTMLKIIAGMKSEQIKYLVKDFIKIKFRGLDSCINKPTYSDIEIEAMLRICNDRYLLADLPNLRNLVYELQDETIYNFISVTLQKKCTKIKTWDDYASAVIKLCCDAQGINRLVYDIACRTLDPIGYDDFLTLIELWKEEQLIIDKKQELQKLLNYIENQGEFHPIEELNGSNCIDDFKNKVMNYFIEEQFLIITLPCNNRHQLNLIIVKDNCKTYVAILYSIESVYRGFVEGARCEKDIYSCDQCIVITNCSLTEKAQDFARKNSIDIWDNFSFI